MNRIALLALVCLTIACGEVLGTGSDTDGVSGTVEGPPGPEGPQGPAGPQGPEGPAGPQGAVGPRGANGEVGPEGAEGPAGPQGAAGPQGPTGPQGAQGPEGPQGPAGRSPVVMGNSGQQLGYLVNLPMENGDITPAFYADRNYSGDDSAFPQDYIVVHHFLGGTVYYQGSNCTGQAYLRTLYVSGAFEGVLYKVDHTDYLYQRTGPVGSTYSYGSSDSGFGCSNISSGPLGLTRVQITSYRLVSDPGDNLDKPWSMVIF